MVEKGRTMLAVEPMRSVIYGDCVREEYRIKLYEWLLKYHIEDSISQFGPYVTKYAFYFALPRPEGSEEWGLCGFIYANITGCVIRMILRIFSITRRLRKECRSMWQDGREIFRMLMWKMLMLRAMTHVT